MPPGNTWQRGSGGDVVRGQIVYLHAFDVGSEVAPARVDSVVSRRPDGAPRKSAGPMNAAVVEPLVTDVCPAPISVAGYATLPIVRVYEIGVVTVTFCVPGVAGELSEWHRFHRPTTADGRSLPNVARDLCREMCDRLGPALRDPVGVGEPEPYTVFCVTDLGGECAPADWLETHERAVAGLLNDTGPDRLSPDQLAETFRHRRSFGIGDLVVPDWEAALVVDRAGDFDAVLQVFEFANLQLEQLRVLDATLDRHLDRAYDHLARRPGLWPGRWAAVLRELRRLRVDASKLADGVTNVTKFVGDWYLARLYLAIRERFHLDDWRASVDQRVAQLDRVYELIRGEVSEQRMFALELLIAILIALELVLAFLVRS